MARLPVHPTRLEQRVFIYGPRDWDQTPNIKVPREIDNILDDIARLTANEVSDRAQDNFLRTTHFNLMSVKDFRNDDFERLVRFVCDFIELRISTREIRHPDDDLKESIYSAVILHCVYQVEVYPELDDILRDMRDSKTERLVTVNLGKFHEVTRMIEDLHRGDRGGRRDDRGARDDRGGRDFRDQYAGRDRGSRDDRGSRGADRGGRDSRNWRERERDSRGSRDSRDSRYSRNERDSRYGRGRDDREEYIPTGREATQMANENQDFVTDDRQWTDRPEQSRREMPRSRDFIDAGRRSEPVAQEVEQLIEERKLSGRCMDVIPAFKGLFGTIPLLQPTQGQTEVEMLQHAAVYGGVQQTSDFAKEVERTLTLAKAVTASGVKFTEIEGEVVVEEPLETYGNVQTMLDSISTQAVTADILDAGENTDGVRNVRHFQAIVDNAFPGYIHLNDFMAGLRNAKTMREVAAIFKRAVSAVNENVNAEAGFGTDLRAVVEKYDRIITQEINSYCKNVLRVSDGDAIGSFMSDFDDLINAVHQGTGEDLYNALLGFCSKLVGNIVEAQEPKFAVEKSIKATFGDSTNFGLAILPISYIVTHLPFTIKELGYKIDSTVALTDNELTPFLRAALDISKTSLETDPTFVQSLRLVVTRDGTTFRLYNYPGRPNVLVLAPMK